jgi:YidC/Oxa1 family membrane protein insertase
VRLALHPMNMTGMRSMRAMQKLQPEIERLRKKFENDPQALNTATMALYRENKVNPMGGCLPMVLQMPLFFALYAVINNAIDLRQAPFFGWIHDLSSPDLVAMIGPLPGIGHFPVRLLPLLMAGTGFLSQVLTPTDPKQAPTMYLMNIFMVFIFYNLPSGLVFYWTVMNLLTAFQQWLAIRGDSGAIVVPEAAVVKGRKS